MGHHEAGMDLDLVMGFPQLQQGRRRRQGLPIAHAMDRTDWNDLARSRAWDIPLNGSAATPGCLLLQRDGAQAGCP